MTGLRALTRDHRTLAMLLLAVVLCVKALVPSGYMVGGSLQTITVQLCFDGTSHKTVQLAVPAEGGSHQDNQGQPDSPCAFSALSMGALGGVDAPLLAIALAFILALGFAPVRPVALRSYSRLLPPSCGPPAIA